MINADLAVVPLALSCLYSIAWSLSLAHRLCRIERTSRLDPLTGLGLGDWLQSERWPAALRSGQPLGAMFLDLDHLKWTNDTKGHEAGDQYIQTAAEVLRQSVRRGVDEVFRSHPAGDEFEVLLFGPLADPRARAEALLQRLSERGVSASVGLAYTTELQFVPARAELRQQAETACRQAKARGGGCVVLADPGQTMQPDAPDSERVDPWRSPTPESLLVQPDSRRALPSQGVHR